MNARLLRALVGAQDCLRAATTAADGDPALQLRITEVGRQVGELLIAAVKDQGITPLPEMVTS